MKAFLNSPSSYNIVFPLFVQQSSPVFIYFSPFGFPLNLPGKPLFATLSLSRAPDHPTSISFPSGDLTAPVHLWSKRRLLVNLYIQVFPGVETFSRYNPRILLRIFSGICSHGISKRFGLSVAIPWDFHLQLSWSALSENSRVRRHLGTAGWPDFCSALNMVVMLGREMPKSETSKSRAGKQRGGSRQPKAGVFV